MILSPPPVRPLLFCFMFFTGFPLRPPPMNYEDRDPTQFCLCFFFCAVLVLTGRPLFDVGPSLFFLREGSVMPSPLAVPSRCFFFLLGQCDLVFCVFLSSLLPFYVWQMHSPPLPRPTDL